ncbi:DUF4625 domain-containing protein [Pedobacter sp. MW01-1-1]|uniref:DUF4625 domain-containing protein n=1 Tax=Pedobacter sp. MW01-1-1 TaxID=3383027 RepID=UPI003FEF1E90
MKINKIALMLTVLVLLAFESCKKEKEVDTEYPVIELTPNSFPQQCSELQRGQTFVFRAKFNDNRALGSSSIDIHHNFDHHNHSTEVNDCGLGSQKTPVNPFLLIKTFAIPAGLNTYEMNQPIEIPANVDPGDYHFLIRLTDKEGWQTIQGISIKIK